jgi:uncharacterized membrane protein YhaH (DUF805 family)
MKMIWNLYKERINRINFFVGIIIVFLISGVVSSLMSILLFNAISDINTLGLYHSVMIIIVTLLIGIFACSLIVRRLHDLGKPSIWSLIALIPLFNMFYLLYLMLTAGENKDNKYGRKLSNSLSFKRIFNL